MYAVSIQSYAQKLKKLSVKEIGFSKRDFEDIKELVRNVSYQEESFKGSLNILILI